MDFIHWIGGRFVCHRSLISGVACLFAFQEFAERKLGDGQVYPVAVPAQVRGRLVCHTKRYLSRFVNFKGKKKAIAATQDGRKTSRAAAGNLD